MNSDQDTSRSRKMIKEKKKRSTLTRNEKVGYKDDIGGLYGLDGHEKNSEMSLQISNVQSRI